MTIYILYLLINTDNRSQFKPVSPKYITVVNKTLYLHSTQTHTHLGGVQPAIVEDDTSGRRLSQRKRVIFNMNDKFGSLAQPPIQGGGLVYSFRYDIYDKFE